MNQLEKMEAKLASPASNKTGKPRQWLFVKAHDLRMLIDYVRARETMCEGTCMCIPPGTCTMRYSNARRSLLGKRN